MGLMELERKWRLRGRPGPGAGDPGLDDEDGGAGAWPSQTRRSRDNPEPLPLEQILQPIPEHPERQQRRAQRRATREGHVRDAAEEIEAPALPLIASATSLPAMWVALRPWPE